MKFTRVWAIFLRYFYPLKRFDSVADLIFWPLIDLLLWGITSSWLQKGETGLGNIALSIMCGLLFWQVIWRSTYDVCQNFVQEILTRNLTNIFGSPLKLSEWITSIMFLGVFKALFALFFAGGMIFALYGLNIVVLSWAIVPFFVLFTLFGWTLGFIGTAFIVYFGIRLQQIGWMLPWMIAPFSAIFYPVSALPEWIQKISHLVPTTALFEQVRAIVQGKPFSLQAIIIPGILIITYLLISIAFFAFMFEKRRQKGFKALE